MRRLVLISMLLQVLPAIAAQADTTPGQPAQENSARMTDDINDETGTGTEQEELAPDIIETTDKSSEDLPLIFPADI